MSYFSINFYSLTNVFKQFQSVKIAPVVFCCHKGSFTLVIKYSIRLLQRIIYGCYKGSFMVVIKDRLQLPRGIFYDCHKGSFTFATKVRLHLS